MNPKDVKGIQKVVADVLKHLSPRGRDIVSRRFGVRNGKRETLEAIGTSYGITRERVRQIEEFSLAQLGKISREHKDASRYGTLLKSLLNREGGALTDRDLFHAVTGGGQYGPSTASLTLLATLADDLYYSDENEHFYAFWAVSRERAEAFQRAARDLAQTLEKHKKVVPFAELASFLGRNGIAFGDGDTSTKHLHAVLAISKEVGKNIYEEVGSATWADIRPRGVRDKAFLIMQKEGKPRHFSDIARLINTARFPDGKPVNVQTVHNELIKDNRFVLVGRGMYALADWGYKAGTVKEVLVDILKSTARPLTRLDSWQRFWVCAW